MTLPLTRTREQRKIFGLHPNVFFLGVVSLLTDISSEMIFTITPLFLANVLNAAASVVGIVGGVTEGADAIFRIFSGWFSDRIGKRKGLAVTGYGLSTLVKPFMYVVGSWGGVLGVRLGDRIGKGVRSSSRDALIADSVAANERGKGFGFHRAMDTSGAVLGLSIGALIIYLIQGSGINLELKAYQWMVIIGVIPAVLAVIVLMTMVREEKKVTSGGRAVFPLSGITRGFKKNFWLFMIVIAIFTLGNSSDFFLILRAQRIDTPLIQVMLMLILFNATYALVAVPMGILSDNVGRRRVIVLGWFIYSMVYFGFAIATHIWQIWVLFALYGLYYGIVEGTARALIADLVPVERRGTAYGLYQGVIGIMLFFASVIAGWMWDTISPSSTFYLGAGLALLATLGMGLFVKERYAPN
jgi:MFS family permease